MTLLIPVFNLFLRHTFYVILYSCYVWCNVTRNLQIKLHTNKDRMLNYYNFLLIVSLPNPSYLSMVIFVFLKIESDRSSL